MTTFRRRAFAAAAVLGLAAAPAAAQNPAWPKSMTLGTASVGGTYFIYGQVWATLVSEATKVNVSTQQTQGPNQNIILVDDKQAELGMTTMGVALQAWNGSGEWTKGKQYRNVRALFPMYDTPFHFITLQRSGITSVKQLAGKSVGVGPRAGTPGTYFPPMFEALGIKTNIRYGGGSDMTSQVGDGLLDVFAFAAGLPIAAFSELETQKGVAFFSFTADEIRTLREKFPELSPSVVPKSTYRTMKEDQPTVGLFNFAIIHKDMPEDLAYAIVKAVHENHPRMVQGHAAARETVPENVAKNGFLPFHPGAARYYREKGHAIPDNLVVR
ncbi:MAG: TAXI family TRAP transporter solute-binding subunit [Alphaproteobacteria bacterium]|nr:TAXI family TRAP transporter solute-binding subunit [Alphaproteobacteria bacterium]